MYGDTRRNHLKLFVILVGIFFIFPLLPSPADGQSHPVKTLTSATVGIEIVPSVGNIGTVVFVPSGSASSVWVGRFPLGQDCTGVTGPVGVEIPAANGYYFTGRGDQAHNGALCGILNAAGTVTVRLEVR